MKKLMIVVAAAAMACATQAAQCTWGASGIGKSTISTSTTTMDKYVAYLFDAATTDYSTLVADITKGTLTGLDDNIGTKTGAGSTASSWMITGAKSKEMGSATGWGEGDKPSVFAIILDNSAGAKPTSFMAIAPKASTKGITSAGAYNVAFGSQTANTWTAIAPEPTSGLLMLLGMAGLALRRRRA